MNRTSALTILLGVALVLPLAAAEPGVLPAQAIVVDEARLEALPRTAAARRLANAADLAIRKRDAAKLQGLLARTSTQDPVLHEWLVATVLQKLRVAPPLPPLEPMLAALVATPARIYRQHPETAAAYYLPVFEPDRMAAGTQETWRRETLAREWLGRLASDPLAFGAAAQAPDAPALVRAVELADARALARLSASLPPQGFAATPGFWATLASRTRDPAHFGLAFRLEGQAVALALLQRVPAILSRDDAKAQLETLLENDALGSAALSTLAAISAGDPAFAPRLFAMLADEGLGATAAAALARTQGAKSIDAAAQRLRNAKGATEQRNLLLYLRLVGSAAAMANAKGAAGLPHLDPALRAELATW